MANPNLELLTDAAKLLEPLLGELVFVGGCATALLITDKAAADVRPTFDVDAISEITSYAEYTEFSGRLKKLGFQEDTREDAPLCRWRQKTTTLDVMPLDAKILGFSNSWYRPAMDHAEERELEKNLKIRLVAPVYFCASKLEAFAGRGKNDFAGSRDLEDLIAVVDGRAELVGEIRAAEGDVRSYLAKEIKKLLSIRAFNDACRVICLRTPAAKKELAQLFCGSKKLLHCSLRSTRNNSSQLIALRSNPESRLVWRRFGKLPLCQIWCGMFLQRSVQPSWRPSCRHDDQASADLHHWAAKSQKVKHVGPNKIRPNQQEKTVHGNAP